VLGFLEYSGKNSSRNDESMRLSAVSEYRALGVEHAQVTAMNRPRVYASIAYFLFLVRCFGIVPE
jgi:hypothetical protein